MLDLSQSSNEYHVSQLKRKKKEQKLKKETKQSLRGLSSRFSRNLCAPAVIYNGNGSEDRVKLSPSLNLCLGQVKKRKREMHGKPKQHQSRPRQQLWRHFWHPPPFLMVTTVSTHWLQGSKLHLKRHDELRKSQHGNTSKNHCQKLTAAFTTI